MEQKKNPLQPPWLSFCFQSQQTQLLSKLVEIWLFGLQDTPTSLFSAVLLSLALFQILANPHLQAYNNIF